MKQAWHPVASVAISTIPFSTRSRSSEEETVLMTAYSVSFSRRARRRASVASATCTVKRALRSSPSRDLGRRSLAADARMPYVRILHSFGSKYVGSAYCVGGVRADTFGMA